MAQDFSQFFNVLQNLVQATWAISKAQTATVLTSSASWTPGGITSGSQVSTTVTCAGATLGMNARAAYSSTVAGLILSAAVTAANTITVTLANMSGGTITPSAGIVTVWASNN